MLKMLPRKLNITRKFVLSPPAFRVESVELVTSMSNWPRESLPLSAVAQYAGKTMEDTIQNRE